MHVAATLSVPGGSAPQMHTVAVKPCLEMHRAYQMLLALNTRNKVQDGWTAS